MNFKELAKTYYLVMRVIGQKKESLSDVLADVSKKIGARPITTVILRAHGSKKSVRIGASSKYTEKMVQASDFRHLEKDGTIIIQACSTAQSLAKQIGEAAKRTVFAAMWPTFHAHYSSCCSKHGISCVQLGFGNFDRDTYIVTEKFTHNYNPLNVLSDLHCYLPQKDIQANAYRKFLILTRAAMNFGDRNEDSGKILEPYDSIMGVPDDPEKAVKWYEKEARNGLVEAQVSLGSCYENGLGVPKDLKKAVEWYEKAAEQNDAEGLRKLSRCYLKGKGVQKNLDKAIELLEITVKQGDKLAIYDLEKARSKKEKITAKKKT